MEDQEFIAYLEKNGKTIYRYAGSVIQNRSFDRYIQTLKLYDDWYYEAYLFLEKHKRDGRFNLFTLPSGVRSDVLLLPEHYEEIGDIQPIIGHNNLIGDDGIEQLSLLRKSIIDRLKLLQSTSFELPLSIDKFSQRFRLYGKPLTTKLATNTLGYIILKVLIENSETATLLLWKDIIPKVNIAIKKSYSKKTIKQENFSSYIQRYANLGIKNLKGEPLISIEKGKGIRIINRT